MQAVRPWIEGHTPRPGLQTANINIGIMEKKMETTVEYWGYIGIMEKNMETTTVSWAYMGIMEKWKLL